MKFLARGTALFLLTALVLSLTACGGNAIVGVWKTEQSGSSMTFEYKKDNTFILSMAADMEGFEDFTVEGTYEIDGDQITTVLPGPDGQEGTPNTQTFIIEGKELTLIENETGIKLMVLTKQ